MKAAIIGASGAIGSAFIEHLLKDDKLETLYAFSRSDVAFDDVRVHSHFIDMENEASIEKAAAFVDGAALDLVIVAVGALCIGDIMPEKSLKEISSDKFQAIFETNMIGPALVAKYFVPLLPKDKKANMAFLSARVGSIDDNGLGGWYAYRASKAALNMVIKNISIEVARKNKQAAIIGLHPGTVDSDLSKPFQAHVKKEKLFSPEYSTQQMLNVLEHISGADSGYVYAYDGKRIDC